MEVFVLCFKLVYQLLVREVEIKVSVGIGVVGKRSYKLMFAFWCNSLSRLAGIVLKQFSTLLCCFTAGKYNPMVELFTSTGRDIESTISTGELNGRRIL